MEERLKKEEERLQRQLEEDKTRGPDRKMRDRYRRDKKDLVVYYNNAIKFMINGRFGNSVF